MMLFYTLYIFLLHIFPTSTAGGGGGGGGGPAYRATDLILLNCGAPPTLNDTSMRTWDSDERSRYAPTNAATISSTSKASTWDPSVSQVPYETARIFHSPFTYSFPVLKGPKFLRLYFYPTNYSSFDASRSFFSVTANGFTLLSNFSAFLNKPSSPKPSLPPPPNPSFKKEFIINVQENQILNLTFYPRDNSFAFINGIEIVSLPVHLYFKGNDVPIKSGDQLSYLRNDTALEKLYRLNVGGNYVGIQDDSGSTRGMFRDWSPDDDYIFGADFGYTPHRDLSIKYTNQTPPYSAPEIVYTTSRATANTSISLEWFFPVDSGFSYLLRFHFCEIQLEVEHQNERVFDIYVDNQPLELQADVILWTGGRQIPIFKDYITWVPDDGHRGKKDLRLSLLPNTQTNPRYESALLNGLEIFKLSDPNQSLAAANPEPAVNSPPPAQALGLPGKRENKRSSVIYPVIGSLSGVLAVVTAATFLIVRRRRKIKDSLSSSTSWIPLSIVSRSTTRTNGSSHPLPSDLCRHFSLDEIKIATGNFDDNLVIGKGGFGNVYKGFIDDGATAVAIKRLNPSSSQGAREFLTEIEMLSKLRYLHLVSLIGYCDQNGEMILVYDYMAHGTLRDHLYNSDNSPLKWKQRLQICIGAAKGLHYLHTGAKHSIIHRDVKSTNVLLDEKWVAKVSDFGLSKVGPTDGAHSHVSTVVKGSIGYVDPEYYKRQQLTDKSDVYSFGVVLFEVLCARPAVMPTFPKEQVSLAEWGKFCYRKGTIEQIIDSNLKGQIAPECLRKFVETAVMCLREKGVERPAMSDVVWSLEFAMQLQEAAENGGDHAVDSGEKFVSMSGRGEPNTTDEEIFSGTSEGLSGSKSSGLSGSKSSGLSTGSRERLKSAEVFSELLNPLGR